jgi:hypothetical protein
MAFNVPAVCERNPGATEGGGRIQSCYAPLPFSFIFFRPYFQKYLPSHAFPLKLPDYPAAPFFSCFFLLPLYGGLLYHNADVFKG